jgi:hypothetical protein
MSLEFVAVTRRRKMTLQYVALRAHRRSTQHVLAKSQEQKANSKQRIAQTALPTPSTSREYQSSPRYRRHNDFEFPLLN